MSPGPARFVPGPVFDDSYTLLAGVRGAGLVLDHPGVHHGSPRELQGGPKGPPRSLQGTLIWGQFGPSLLSFMGRSRFPFRFPARFPFRFPFKFLSRFPFRFPSRFPFRFQPGSHSGSHSGSHPVSHSGSHSGSHSDSPPGFHSDSRSGSHSSPCPESHLDSHSGSHLRQLLGCSAGIIFVFGAFTHGETNFVSATESTRQGSAAQHQYPVLVF